jgi:hypothetical protein
MNWRINMVDHVFISKAVGSVTMKSTLTPKCIFVTLEQAASVFTDASASGEAKK